jgi:hypothetical protein
MRMINHSAALGGRVYKSEKIISKPNIMEGKYKNEQMPIAIPTLNNVDFGCWL